MSTTESHKRSIVKAFTYRFFGTIFTIGMVFILTGQVKLSFTIGLLDTIGRTLTYFIHERIWTRVKFGLSEKKPVDYEI